MPLQALPSNADLPPAGSTDIDPLICQHPGCPNTLEYGGRGRRPRFCEEHKTASSSGSTKGTRWANRATVESALTSLFAGTSFVVTMVNPADGKVIATGGKAVTQELLKLGDIDKQWRKVLDKLAAPGKYGPLVIVTFTTIIIPLCANHNLLPQFKFEPISDSPVREPAGEPSSEGG